MNRTEKPKAVIESTDLARYKLAKPILAKLDRANQMVAYMALSGQKAPPYIRLSQHDFNDIDRCVREQSNKRFTGADVLWHGRSVIGGSAPAPQFHLESAA